jgi:hypothetical protein
MVTISTADPDGPGTKMTDGSQGQTLDEFFVD